VKLNTCYIYLTIVNDNWLKTKSAVWVELSLTYP